MPYDIERYHDISTGHRVHGHESKCAHLHGHNYRVFFTVEPVKWLSVNPELDKMGRVVDFSVVKSTLCQWLEDNWDHKFLVAYYDPIGQALEDLDPHGVVRTPFNPTAENMAAHLVNEIGPMLLMEYNVILVKCRIEETRKCSATYYLENNR